MKPTISKHAALTPKRRHPGGRNHCFGLNRRGNELFSMGKVLYVRYLDGSIRHAHPRLKGKALKKRIKRERRLDIYESTPNRSY